MTQNCGVLRHLRHCCRSARAIHPGRRGHAGVKQWVLSVIPRFAGLTYPHRACFPEFGRVLDCPANRPTKVISMIPAEKMIALWDTNDKQQITKLAVEHISHQPASTRVLPASAGSCTIGWLGENPIDKSDRSFFVPRSFPRVSRSPNCDARAARIQQSRRPKLGEGTSKTQRGARRGRRGRIRPSRRARPAASIGVSRRSLSGGLTSTADFRPTPCRGR
jgi:hypothetical protein